MSAHIKALGRQMTYLGGIQAYITLHEQRLPTDCHLSCTRSPSSSDTRAPAQADLGLVIQRHLVMSRQAIRTEMSMTKK